MIGRVADAEVPCAATAAADSDIGRRLRLSVLPGNQIDDSRLTLRAERRRRIGHDLDPAELRGT